MNLRAIKDHWSPGERVLTRKGLEEKSWGPGEVPLSSSDDGYPGVCMCKKVSHSTLEICALDVR